MVKLPKVLSYMPFGGNFGLWKLRHEVENDRFLRIFGDIAKLIRNSEKACEEASKEEEPDYRDLLIDAECEYLEELIGASFVVLQAKIRRVTTSAVSLHKAMLSEHQIDLDKLRDEDRVRALCGNYKDTDVSLVQLTWDIGNYYKHRDEWVPEVWHDEIAGKKDRLKQPRNTRRNAEKARIKSGSTGPLRAAYDFFDINPYSKCELLAASVQHWADQVHEAARTQLKAKVEALPETPDPPEDDNWP